MQTDQQPKRWTACLVHILKTNGVISISTAIQSDMQTMTHCSEALLVITGIISRGKVVESSPLFHYSVMSSCHILKLSTGIVPTCTYLNICHLPRLNQGIKYRIWQLFTQVASSDWGYCLQLGTISERSYGACAEKSTFVVRYSRWAVLDGSAQSPQWCTC